MINIAQATNYDNLPIEDEYFIINFDSPVFKLGFCGDSLSIGKTIYLTIEGEEKPFEIGKTGMFEFQPESYKDVNIDSEEREAIVHCTRARIPADLKFTLDYCWEA